jgi:hypothetical protein
MYLDAKKAGIRIFALFSSAEFFHRIGRVTRGAS